MQVTKMVLTTDSSGRIEEMPPLPPNAQLEAIFLLVEQKPTTSIKRRPSPRIAGLGSMQGDLIVPAADPEDWEALK